MAPRQLCLFSSVSLATDMTTVQTSMFYNVPIFVNYRHHIHIYYTLIIHFKAAVSNLWEFRDLRPLGGNVSSCSMAAQKANRSTFKAHSNIQDVKFRIKCHPREVII